MIAGFGRRDVPIDDQLPVILGRYGPSRLRETLDGVTVDKLDDQHRTSRCPAALDITPGELLSFGISHPCGAFDRWPSIPLVDDDHTVLGTITTDL